jgi:multiple sugar transport system permease protein
MRQFFLTIPRELDESALIDGANRWDIFARIIIPLSKPIVVTILAFSFVSHWNDFFGPLIYLNHKDRMTLAVGLLLFKGDVDTLYHLLMAASVITVMPVVIVFFVAQRQFVAGIAMTGMREG